MVAQRSFPLAAPADSGDRRFVIHGVKWDTYVALRRSLDRAGSHVHITYLEGTMELMSPGPLHEDMKTRIARLLEAYAGVRGISLNGRGGQTFRRKAKERGLEPDECYFIGPPSGAPHIAIEVVTSRGLVDKLSVYEGLRVRELWLWQKGTISFRRLTARGYEVRPKSDVLPELDVVLFARFLENEDQTQAAEQYRAALKRKKR